MEKVRIQIIISMTGCKLPKLVLAKPELAQLRRHAGHEFEASEPEAGRERFGREHFDVTFVPPGAHGIADFLSDRVSSRC
jgi:hypothetical protein